MKEMKNGCFFSGLRTIEVRSVYNVYMFLTDFQFTFFEIWIYGLHCRIHQFYQLPALSLIYLLQTMGHLIDWFSATAEYPIHFHRWCFRFPAEIQTNERTNEHTFVYCNHWLNDYIQFSKLHCTALWNTINLMLLSWLPRQWPFVWVCVCMCVCWICANDKRSTFSWAEINVHFDESVLHISLDDQTLKRVSRPSKLASTHSVYYT